jgi:hypothetical protein
VTAPPTPEADLRIYTGLTTPASLQWSIEAQRRQSRLRLSGIAPSRRPLSSCFGSSGIAGIAIANDAQTGKLLWKTPIGLHSGHDNDGILTEHSATGHGKVKEPPYTTLPGGIESPYPSDGTTAIFPMNNFGIFSKTQAANGTADYTEGASAMVAIDQDTGKIKWHHKFKSTPYGATTVSNDLVWATTFDGTLWALNTKTGAVVWHMKLPAGTSAPVAIDGDTVVTGAGLPLGANQRATFIAYRLGATGSEFGFEQGRVHQGFVRLEEQRDRGQPQGGHEGVLQHLRLLPHARGRWVDRHRRTQPRPAQALRCAGRPRGHQRRRRNARLRQLAVKGPNPVGRQVRLDGGRHQEEQARPGRRRRAVTIKR